MKVKFKKLNSFAQNPQRANDSDAGFDLIATNKSFPSHSESGLYVEFGTGISLEIPKGYVGLLFPRSSISKTRHSLRNSVGVIDSGYRGNIKLCFKYIAQPQDMKIVEGKTVAGKKASGIVTSIDPQRIYHKGDKIGQLVPCLHNDMNLEIVDQLSSSNRGAGGFGSTDL